MSTYWYLYCRTCETGDVEHVGWWNHGADRGLRAVIPLLPALATLGRALDDNQADITLDWYGPEDRSGLINFAKAHAAHDVVCKSEYGEIDGTCAARFECSGEGCHRTLYCTLEHGHDGPHRRVITKL